MSVRGRSGVGREVPDGSCWLHVEAEFRQPILVTGSVAAGIGLPDLVRVADELTVNLSPHPGWLGQR